jgi:lipopolysaccharide biosynthesis glycosyltransferase
MTETSTAFRGELIQVLFCCNPAYYQHLSVTLVSMLENNTKSRFAVHLILSARDQTLEEKLWRSLRAYRNFSLAIHHFPLTEYSHFFVDNHVTIDAYLRIFAADILDRKIEKILYLDCDLVVLGDLRDLWSTDVNGYALAAVPDPFGAGDRTFLGIPPGRPYVNTGVMLLNLMRWRTEHLSQQLVRFIEAHGSSLWYWDQDAINAVLHDSILALDYRWNVQAQMFKSKPKRFLDLGVAICEARRQPAIIHYSSAEKPWLFRAIVKKKLLYFDYLEKTDWRGTKPFGLAWYNLPEFYLDHLLARAGIDYTIIVRVLRRIRGILKWSVVGLRHPPALVGKKQDAETSSTMRMAKDR